MKNKPNEKFISGNTIGLADFCIAAFYFDIIDREPTVMPVFLDEHKNLRNYFELLEETFQNKN